MTFPSINYTNDDFEAAVAAVRAKTSLVPRIAVILGSGMGDVANLMTDNVTLAYDEIPNFPNTSAPSHVGQLHIGTIQDVPCVVMQGRVHLYEGYSPQEVVFPVRLMKKLGAELLFATNAAGGVNASYTVGDFVLVNDHINLAGMTGMDPMRGVNLEQFGERFTPLNQCYSPAHIDNLEQLSKQLNIRVHRGVYGYVAGPSFETPAEVRMLRLLGIDAVGMSTVPEVLAARHCNMQVTVVSTVTNTCIDDIHSTEVTTEEDVWRNTPAIAKNMSRLLTEFLKSNPKA